MPRSRNVKVYEFPYFVSDDGKVFKHGRELKRTLSSSGYYKVTINKVQKFVHKIVAEVFIENISSKPQVNHIDGNKLNNCAENLEWCTQQENQRHAWDSGLRGVSLKWIEQSKKNIKKAIEKSNDPVIREIQKRSVRSLTMQDAEDIRSMFNSGMRIYEIQPLYMVCRETISRIVKGKTYVS